MTTLLPKDSNNETIPALRLKNGGAHQITVTSASNRNATAFSDSTRIISLYSTVPAYIAFGNSDINADTNQHYLPAGLYYDISIGGDDTAHYTYIAAIRAEQDGILYISEKE